MDERDEHECQPVRQVGGDEGGGKKKKKDGLDARHPAVLAQLEKARRVLYARRAQLALRVLDGRLGLRRGVHVLGEDGAREVAPQPAALVWLLLVLGSDPLGRDVAAVLQHVEQCALLGGLTTSNQRCMSGRTERGGGRGEGDVVGHTRTLAALNSISALHLPLTSPSSVEPCFTRPAMALYVPEKKPLVLNSRSAWRSCASLRTVHVSPSSRTIFPKRIPRPYMFGIVNTYSTKGQRVTASPTTSKHVSVSNASWVNVEVGGGHAITCVFRAIHQGDAALAFHRRHHGVTEEP